MFTHSGKREDCKVRKKESGDIGNLSFVLKVQKTFMDEKRLRSGICFIHFFYMHIKPCLCTDGNKISVRDHFF